MAVLSKAGCNAGTCHGNKNGKGGFKLSLRGQEPDTDFWTLTHGLLGRRINPIKPERSMILAKPTVEIAHEGGLRFNKESQEYGILFDWIASGFQNDLGSAPAVLGIDVEPSQAILIDPSKTIPITVTARFADGTRRDVTSLSVFEASNGLATVEEVGVVRRAGFGETTILVRYLQHQAPVRLTFVPERPDFAWNNPPNRNYIDSQVFSKLRTLRINPSVLCSDTVFLRRAFLDLLGFLPSAEEARRFARDNRPDKRSELVDGLLERPEFADFWALKWCDLLRNEAHSLDQKGVQNFHHWVRQNIAENTPLDQFARALVTGRGSTYKNPAANYYRPNRDPATRAKAAAQVFLGVRLQCAECHNHPFDRWTQDDYYDWADVFARVDYKVLENKRDIGSDKHEWKGEQIVYYNRKGSVLNPRTGTNAKARFLASGNMEINPGESLLDQLATWLTSPENRMFSSAQANRVWYHLMGRGLVDPIDDFRATNPATHPELLNLLADDFVEHKFDLRHLIRLIMDSRIYQLSSEPNETNESDLSNYSHVVVRRISAEQLLDSQSQITGVPLKFDGFPEGMRAAQLPGVRPEGKRERHKSEVDQFLEIFGKPPRLMTTEAERSCDCNMGQAFQMISGPTVNELVREKNNCLKHLLESGKNNREIVEELYWAVLSSPPDAEGIAPILEYIDESDNQRTELEDLLWGLLNSKEFIFRR
ncbi:MAG: DUF1549 and DUF1553 domain-containing protein [Verrucomicrobia bacterium]|nr:DUF1549 and DUF1553 domain-containing protein [Verrucomicrobiota bacterium]